LRHLEAAWPRAVTRLMGHGPHGGPLRGSWWAATRLVVGRYAARGGPLRGSWRAAGRVAAQVYHTRPKLFYETQDRERTPLRVFIETKRAVL
jgi:hypothetical protein